MYTQIYIFYIHWKLDWQLCIWVPFRSCNYFFKLTWLRNSNTMRWGHAKTTVFALHSFSPTIVAGSHTNSTVGPSPLPLLHQTGSATKAWTPTLARTFSIMQNCGLWWAHEGTGVWVITNCRHGISVSEGIGTCCVYDSTWIGYWERGSKQICNHAWGRACTSPWNIFNPMG